MVNNIKERIDKKGKMAVNLTLDKSLCDLILKYKRENGIVNMSPMINEMLWDWFNKLNNKTTENGN